MSSASCSRLRGLARSTTWSVAWARCRWTRPARSPARSTSCCGAAGLAVPCRPTSTGCSGTSVRCSSTGRTSSRSTTTRSTASRCDASADRHRVSRRDASTGASGWRPTRRSAATCSRELRRRGPLRTRDLEDRSVEGGRPADGTTRGSRTAMMLELLWARGEVMVAGRDGQQRLWDLAERCLPVDEPRSSPTASRAPRRRTASSARAASRRRGRSAGRSTGEPPGGSARCAGWSARASRSPPRSAT